MLGGLAMPDLSLHQARYKVHRCVFEFICSLCGAMTLFEVSHLSSDLPFYEQGCILLRILIYQAFMRFS